MGIQGELVRHLAQWVAGRHGSFRALRDEGALPGPARPALSTRAPSRVLRAEPFPSTIGTWTLLGPKAENSGASGNGAPDTGPGKSPSWAGRKFSALVPAFLPKSVRCCLDWKRQSQKGSWQLAQAWLQSWPDLGANPDPAVGTGANDFASLSLIFLICLVGCWDTSLKHYTKVHGSYECQLSLGISDHHPHRHCQHQKKSQVQGPSRSPPSSRHL